MNPDKSIVQSKTMWGIFAAWFALKVKTLLAMWGIDVPDEFVTEFTNLLIEGGLFLAAIGRLVAEEKLR